MDTRLSGFGWWTYSSHRWEAEGFCAFVEEPVLFGETSFGVWVEVEAGWLVSGVVLGGTGGFCGPLDNLTHGLDGCLYLLWCGEHCQWTG